MTLFIIIIVSIILFVIISELKYKIRELERKQEIIIKWSAQVRESLAKGLSGSAEVGSKSGEAEEEKKVFSQPAGVSDDRETVSQAAEREERTQPIIPESKPEPKAVDSSIQSSEKTFATIDKKPAKKESSEIKVSVLLGRIGIVIVLFGIVFMYRMAIERGFIHPSVRVAVGLLLSASVLYLGDYFLKKYPRWALMFTGGGLAALYFTIFAAGQLYGLFNVPVSFILMALTTALAGYLSLRYDSRLVAVYGIVGGFMTPIMLGIESLDPWFVMLYVLILDFGVLWLASKKNWFWMNVVGFIFSAFYLIAATEVESSIGAKIVYIVALFILYNIIPIAKTLFSKLKINSGDIVLIALNAMLTFGLLSEHLDKFLDKRSMGLIAIGMAAIYALQGNLVMQRSPDDRLIRISFGLISIVFLFSSVPMIAGDINGAVTVLWSLMGLAVLALGLKMDSKFMRVVANIIVGLAIINLFDYNFSPKVGEFAPIFNTRFLTFAIVIAVLYVGAWIYMLGDKLNLKESSKSEYILVKWAYPILASILTLGWLHVEISAFFYQKELLQSGVVVGSRQLSMRDASGLYKQTSVLTHVMAYFVYATVLLIIASKKHLRPIGMLANVVIAIAAMQLLFGDTRIDVNHFVPIFNLRFLVTIIGLSAMYYASSQYLTKDNQELKNKKRDGYSDLAMWVYPVVISLVALWWINLELNAIYGHSEVVLSGGVNPDVGRKMSSAGATGLLRQSSYMMHIIIFNVYALILLTIAELKRLRPISKLAVIIIAITALKLLFGNSGVIIGEFIPIFNLRFLAYLLSVSAVYVSGWILMYRTKFDKSETGKDVVEIASWVFPILASALTLWWLNLEINAFFLEKEIISGVSKIDPKSITMAGASRASGYLQASQMTHTIAFVLYSIGLLAVGINRRLRPLRIMSLGILLLMIIKILFVDTKLLNELYRVSAFVIVGVLLIVASYSYQRFKWLIMDDSEKEGELDQDQDQENRADQKEGEEQNLNID